MKLTKGASIRIKREKVNKSVKSALTDTPFASCTAMSQG